MQDIIARRNAVERIARRLGYSGYRAEEIAQEAALQLLENPNLRSQTAKFAFIDSLRGSGEAIYNRAGRFTQPIFESEFEDYANFIDGVGSQTDSEREQIIRSELLNTLSCLEVLNQREQEVMRLHVEGFTMDEISERYGITESRICQIIELSRKRLKEAIVSQGLSRQKQRSREWQESHAIPRGQQALSRIQEAISFAMAAFRCKAIEGMVSFKVPKVPQSLFTSF